VQCADEAAERSDTLSIHRQILMLMCGALLPI